MLKVGDLIEYSDVLNDRLGVIGLVINTCVLGNYEEEDPPTVEILWENGEFEQVFEDELKLLVTEIEVIGEIS